MPLEIERKFLVVSNDFKSRSKAIEIKQAYLSIEKRMAIRVRLEGIQASINIKSKKSERVNHELLIRNLHLYCLNCPHLVVLIQLS